MEQKSPGRYYSHWQILAGAFLGGPLAAGFFIAGDYSAFGTPGKGRAVLVISCLVVVAGAFLRGPGGGQLELGDALLAAGFVAALYGVYARFALATEIARRRGTGWLPHPWSRVLGISAAFMIAILLLAALAAPNPGGPA